MGRNGGMTKLELILSSVDSQPQKVLTLVGDIWETEKGTGVRYNDCGVLLAYR